MFGCFLPSFPSTKAEVTDSWLDGWEDRVELERDSQGWEIILDTSLPFSLEAHWNNGPKKWALSNYAVFPLCLSKSSMSFICQKKENSLPPLVICPFSEYVS